MSERAFTGKLSMEGHKKKFDNFCETIIEINWNEKIKYIEPEQAFEFINEM